MSKNHGVVGFGMDKASRLNLGDVLINQDIQPALRSVPTPAENRVQRLRSERPLRRTFAPGELIGNHKILKVLGRGSMGEVYLCEHIHLPDLKVALKVLAPASRAAQQMRERFKNEISASARVSHRNVIRAYEFIEKDQFLAYTMEFVSGGDLGRWMREHTTFNVHDALRILIQLCEGIQAIHDAGVIHRDIKPENILITESGEIRISDFAVARTADFRRVTLRGQLVGTIDYLSPQYLEHGTVSRECDIYAVGAVAYELFTHRAPFIASGMYDAMVQKLSCEAPLLHDVNSGVPHPVSTIVARALRRNPSERYQSARELGEELKRLLRGPSIPSTTMIDVDASLLAADAGPTKAVMVQSHKKDDPSASGERRLILVKGGLLDAPPPIRTVKQGAALPNRTPAQRTSFSLSRVLLAVSFTVGFIIAVLGVATHWAEFQTQTQAPGSLRSNNASEISLVHLEKDLHISHHTPSES
jgi:serine/threonine protein kinase